MLSHELILFENALLDFSVEVDEFALAMEHIILEHTDVVGKCVGEANSTVAIEFAKCKLSFLYQLCVLVDDTRNAGLTCWVFFEQSICCELVWFVIEVFRILIVEINFWFRILWYFIKSDWFERFPSLYRLTRWLLINLIIIKIDLRNLFENLSQFLSSRIVQWIKRRHVFLNMNSFQIDEILFHLGQILA